MNNNENERPTVQYEIERFKEFIDDHIPYENAIDIILADLEKGNIADIEDDVQYAKLIARYGAQTSKIQLPDENVEYVCATTEDSAGFKVIVIDRLDEHDARVAADFSTQLFAIAPHNKEKLADALNVVRTRIEKGRETYKEQITAGTV